MESKKNILIVGNSSAVSVFIKKIQNYENVGKIYVTGNFLGLAENIETIDIREEKVEELLKFAFEHEINLTVSLSEKATLSDIAGIFNANGQMIFAPELGGAKYFLDKSSLKKLLYKLGIKIPQFGIFDKLQNAVDYLKSAKLPVIIGTASPQNENDIFACPTISVGNIAINDLFFRGEEKIVIDEYISGHNFTTYIITDGVSALPLMTIAVEKFSDDVEGGFYTLGASAIVPDFKITQDIENYIIYDVWEKISAYFEKGDNSYLGIVGISGVLTDNDIFITDVTSGINPADAPVLLNSIDENLVSLFEACAIGSFTDDYDLIKTNDLACISLSLFSHTEDQKIIESENMDLCTKIFNGQYLTQKGFIGTISASAPTLTRAKQKLTDELENLNPKNLKFRKDLTLVKEY